MVNLGWFKMFNNIIHRFSPPKRVKKEDIYSKETRERLLDDGAINNEEDGFMEGYGKEEFIDDHETDEDEEGEHPWKGGDIIEEMY